MVIQLLENTLQWDAGDVVEVDDQTGQWLVNVGKATTNIETPEPEVEPEPEPDDEPDVDYSDLTVAELQGRLEALGLPKSGLKAELVERLENA